MSEELEAYVEWLQELKAKDPDKFVFSVARLLMFRDHRVEKLQNIIKEMD